MSFYQLAPSPDLSTRESNYAFWNDGFTTEDLDRIVSLGESATPEKAIVGKEKALDEDIRKSKVVWFPATDDTRFIYEKLGFIVRGLNGQFFDFDITGFMDDLQYTVYDGDTNDHYDWHMDKGLLSGAPRKLSLTLQLSDPADYEGGDLELFIGSSLIVKAEKKRGLVFAFPSYIVHRVTPVTKGVRRSLVAWIAGPKFR